MAKIKKPKRHATPAQIEQRKNALQKAQGKQTGPKTEKGKKTSAMNAWQTGETATSVRASMIGRPCQSTCPKFADDGCVFIVAEKTQPGGKCMDVGDWNIVEETAEAIIAFQNGEPDKLQGLSSMMIGMNVSLIKQLFADIQARGLWLRSDIIDAEGATRGHKEEVNPLIALMTKMIEKQGINLPELLATPASKAKAITDEGAQQSMAEINRNMSRLLPASMQMPVFNSGEISEAEIVEEHSGEE